MKMRNFENKFVCHFFFFWLYSCWVWAEQFQLISKKSEQDFVVPKPKGQAGRGDGYNLYEEMRLSSNTTYNIIRVLHFLD